MTEGNTPGMTTERKVIIVLASLLGIALIASIVWGLVAILTPDVPDAVVSTQPNSYNAPAEPYEPEPYDDGKALYLDLLEKTWDNQGSTAQLTICRGWALGYSAQDSIVDQFDSTIASTPLTRADIRNFFDGKCG